MANTGQYISSSMLGRVDIIVHYIASPMLGKLGYTGQYMSRSMLETVDNVGLHIATSILGTVEILAGIYLAPCWELWIILALYI